MADADPNLMGEMHTVSLCCLCYCADHKTGLILFFLFFFFFFACVVLALTRHCLSLASQSRQTGTKCALFLDIIFVYSSLLALNIAYNMVSMLRGSYI
jgi:hypothetical protein